MKMFKKISAKLPPLFIAAVIFIFFAPFFLKGKIPIPADTIVGMYHPFRDVVWDNLKAGVPFKNFLITDSVRQQYPWRKIAVSQLQNGVLPLWNAFSFSGTPLLANLQSAVFNPLNFMFFMIPFPSAWGVQVFLQLLLSGLFMYLWLHNLSLSKKASVFGALSLIFSGFYTAWLEWNTVLHSALWLPLLLLSIDKLLNLSGGLAGKQKQITEILSSKKIFIWSLIFILSLSFSFFAGHLQTFFYVAVFSYLYLLAKVIFIYRKIKFIRFTILQFTVLTVFIFLIIAVQLIPAFEFILNSARSFDQPAGFRTDWYLPYKHLIQLIAPDFFGNPSTLNYWGNWNYGEFVSYIGIIPLLTAITAIFGRRGKKVMFLTGSALIAVLFALPNMLSYLPYKLNIPFISTTAPSRLIFIFDFSMVVLASLGFDWLEKKGKLKHVIISGGILLIIFGAMFLSIYYNLWGTAAANLVVAKRNTYLPLLLGFAGLSIILLAVKTKKNIILYLLLLFTVFDLLRFGQKFNPFVQSSWIFPKTGALEFLMRQEKPFRIMSLDSRILPPNFTSSYGIETIEGYDPLYSLSYGEFMAAVVRGRPDITPFNFNRIVTPQLKNNPFIDLLNTRYLLSLTGINADGLKPVYQEGETRIYENLNAGDRAFFVKKTAKAFDKQDAIRKLFKYKNELKDVAVVEGEIRLQSGDSSNTVSIINNNYNRVEIKTKTSGTAFLVLANSYYPGWKVKVDGETASLIRTDYALMGVAVPEGIHNVVFYYQPASFYIGLATTVLGFVLLGLWSISIWIKKSA